MERWAFERKQWSLPLIKKSNSLGVEDFLFARITRGLWALPSLPLHYLHVDLLSGTLK